MTIDSTRITLLFSTLSGAEEASMSFGTAPIASPGQQALEDLAGVAVSEFMAAVWDAAPGALFPTTTTFLGAAARSYDVQNDLIASGQSLLTTPEPGSGATVTLPPGVAEVLSLRTPIPGARGRGRMYLPALCVDEVTSAGRINTTARDVLVNAMAAFIDGWNDDLTTQPVAVVSQAGSTVTTVNQIRMGNVFDSQRRRRDQLIEQYAVVDIP